jgi:hypothetical protein
MKKGKAGNVPKGNVKYTPKETVVGKPKKKGTVTGLLKRGVD